MKQRDIPQGENMTDAALAQWAQAFGFIATRYRVACSPTVAERQTDGARPHPAGA